MLLALLTGAYVKRYVLYQRAFQGVSPLTNSETVVDDDVDRAGFIDDVAEDRALTFLLTLL